MKEKLYTIPLNDAINARDECPLCFVERALEQDLLDFTLGSCASYMESDVREITDREGFCRSHFKKMFDYGNTLGNGWILKTHYIKMRSEFQAISKNYQPGKISLTDKLLKKNTDTNPLAGWVHTKEASCYICNRMREIYTCYIDTFFVLFEKDEEFRQKIKNGKGFCFPHFADLCEAADQKLSGQSLTDFYDIILPLMQQNLDRMQEDVDWLVEKFDYRYKDADWKNSKDAIQRGMQKLKGGYPADSPYKPAR